MLKKVNRMRFIQAKIDGFGKWVDKTFTFSEQGLTCLFGENEAGKSTLQQFVLYMLFGLPPRKRNFYQPKSSNRIGGTLTIQDDRLGIYTIERVGDQVRCLMDNGEERDENWLHEYLKGMSREVYTSIYAFSALDLVHIRRMKAEQLSNVLFSVGLTGATSIYQVERQLTNKLGHLFKKAGRKPVINEQLKLVESQYEALQTIREKEVTYQDKRAGKQKLEEELAEEQTNFENLQQTLYQKEKMLHVVPLLTDYHICKRKLNQFPTEMPFPEDGINRLQQLKNQLIPLTSERDILQKNIREYKEQITNLKAKMLPITVYEKAKAILKQKQSFEQLKMKINEKEQEKEQLSRLIQEQLHEIGLKELDFEQTVFPFHLERTWKEIKDTNLQLQQESERLAEEQHLLSEERNRLNEEEEKIQTQLMSEQETMELQQKINEYDFAQSAIQKEIQQKKQWTQWKQKQQRIANWVLIGTITSVSLSVILAILLQNDFMFIFPVFLGLAGFFLYFIIRKSVKEIDKDLTKKVLSTNLSKEKRAKYNKIIQEHQDLQANLKTIKNERTRLEFQHLKWEERKKLFNQKESHWMERLKREHELYPFLKQVEPTHWIELLHKIRQMKRMVSNKNEIEKLLAHLYEEKHASLQEIASFAKNIRWEKDTLSFAQIEELVESYEESQRLIKQNTELLQEAKQKIKALNEKIFAYEHEIDRLLKIANVQDEEAYFKVSREIKERESLLEQKTKLEQQIGSMFSNETIDDLLKKELNRPELEMNISQLKQKLEESQSSVTEKHKLLASIETEINQMEMSDSNSEATLYYQMERDKLEKLAKKWAVYQVAQEALQQAKETFQQKYLTEVIELTSTYFEQLTNGRYVRIYAPTASKLFQVEANNYVRYTVEELSQGTIDQLYVSLRLAISKVMSNRYSLPLMIDDAFVHFDEVRTRQIIHLLKELAQEQQILLFTCKKEIANELQTKNLISNVNV